MNIRFRLQHDSIPALHQVIGPDYLKLLGPGIGSQMREVIAQYTAEQVYSTARQEIQDKIRERTEERLGDKMMEGEGQALLQRRDAGHGHPLRYAPVWHRIAGGVVDRDQPQDRAVLHLRGIQVPRRARKARVRSARRSRPKAFATSSRSSARASRTPICAGAASRRRFSSRSPRIRRS